MVIEIGRLAMKTAGRDAGKECLIIEVLKEGYVTIDGNTRRRKCNITHLNLKSQVVKIKKGATHSEVISALKKLGVEIIEKPEPKFGKKEKSPKKEKKGIFGKKKAIAKKENKETKSKTKAKVKKEKSSKKK